MFDFMRRSGARSPTDAIRRALEGDGLPPGIDALSALRVVESRGRYSGRTVTSIRVFDPARAAGRGLDVRAFKDLESYPDLVLRAGQVGQDGTVLITRRTPRRRCGSGRTAPRTATTSGSSGRTTPV